MLDRRGFLGRLGVVAVAPFAVNAVLVPAAVLADNVWDARGVGQPLDLHVNGNRYRYIKAQWNLCQGDTVCIENGKCLGVAASDIRAGDSGYVQISGVAAVRRAT